MQNYCLATDSTADLPFELIQEFDIKVIPLSYEVEGSMRQECFDQNRKIELKKFYERIRNGEKIKTSQINPTEFVDFFSPILANGQDILYIAFSSALSGTYGSAKIALDELKKKFPERKIFVVDSLSASLGEGLIVYETALKKRTGISIEKLTQWIEDNKLKICHWFILDDLNHLKSGGRISTMTAFFGSILNVKPLLNVDDNGCLVIKGKHRGKRKSLELFVKNMKNSAILPVDNFFVTHSQCQEDAEFIADKVKSEFGTKKIVINEIGSVIGSHTGIGTVAIFFRGNKRDR
ncbi:MAG: DegV family protein [Oscillospiraceae bacterium]|jgi:DegV family protein with EDD domain|nr:DegV family protein [Oscillospiraceae bacterium]